MGAYVVGSMEQDATQIDRGGWIIGSFFPKDGDDGSRNCDALEVKYWSFDPGGADAHGEKVSSTVEWTYLLSGRVRARIGDETVELAGGDYVLIHPGTPNNVVAEVLESTVAITVKAPSRPDAKKLL